MDIEKDESREEIEGELLPEPPELSEPPEAAAESAEEGRKRDKKRRLASGAVALVTSASVLVGGLFNSPALLPDEENILPQVVYTQNDNDDLDGSGDDGNNDEGSQEEAEERAAEAADAESASPPDVWDDERRRQHRLPLAVRLLAIPLAALVCWLVFSGASVLLGSLLSGVLAKLLVWALMGAALLLGFAAAVKAVFPDLPLKKILNRRSITGVLIGWAALAAADIVLPLLWVEYTRVEAIVRALGILAVIGTAAGSFTLRENKRRKALAEAEPAEAVEAESEKEEEAEKPLSREEILALADSVGRKQSKS